MKTAERILLTLAFVSIIIDVCTKANYGGILLTMSLCSLSFFYSAFGVFIFQENEITLSNFLKFRKSFTSIDNFVLDFLIRLSFGTAPIAILAILQNYSWHSQARDIIIVCSIVLILFLLLNKKITPTLKKQLLIRSSIAGIIGLILKFVTINL